MSNEETTRDLVRRAGDALPVRPAPVQDLLQQGRSTRLRRARTTIGAVAASVVVVTGGAVAVGSQLTNDATHEPSVAAPTASDATPLVPPAGMRYVGYGRIGIAVPVTSPGRTRCEGLSTYWPDDGGQGTYRGGPFRPGGRAACGLPVSTSFSSYPANAAFYEEHVTKVRSLGTFRVHQYGPYPLCAFSDCLTVVKAFEGVLLSRSHDAAIHVSGRSRAEVSRILDTAFAIPDGYVAIPSHPDPAELRALGLRAKWSTRLPPVQTDGTVVHTDPQAGSIVPVGSRVTMRLHPRTILPGE